MGKLFVIQARDVSNAIILRRGPRAWYHLIAWDTATDELEHGAWIKGRIYADRCDLSPDGKLFLYFVHQPRTFRALGAWTALSRPPWLKALALWPNGDTYGGGGRFTGSRMIALRPSFYGSSGDCYSNLTDLPITIDCDSPTPLLTSRGIAPNADWSDLDRNGNPIYSIGDRLFRQRECGGEVLIADFSGLKPDPQPAPKWAETFP